MKNLLNHMGPVFKQWADQYFESEIANQFENFKQKHPEESAQIDLENFKEKLLAYHVYSGHYIDTRYFKKDINEIIQQAQASESPRVVLSEKLVDFIEELQDNEWCGLDGYQKVLSDAVCFIGTILYKLEDNEQQDAMGHIEALCLTRSKMEALRITG